MSITVGINMFAHPAANTLFRTFNREGDSSLAEYWGIRFAIVILLTWAASFAIGFQLALTILTVIGFVAAIAGLGQPTLGLFGIGMLCTMDAIMGPFLLSGGLLRWNTLNYWLLVVIVLFLPFILRLSDLQTRLLQLLILLLGLEIVNSPYKELGVQIVLSVVTYFGVLVYFARAHHNRDNWYWLGLIVGILAGAGGLVYYLQQSRLPEINRNIWGFFPLTALFTICMSFAFSSGRARGRVMLVLLALINFVWIFLSGSREGVVIAFICVVFLISRIKGVVYQVGILVMALLVIAGVAALFPDLQANTLDRFDLLVDSSRDSLVHRTSGRSDLVLGGWYIFSEHPFGVGTGGFPVAWANLGFREDLSNRVRGVAFPAHAAWIKVFSENGIPGGILFAAYLLSFAITGRRRHDRNLAMLALWTTVVLSVAFTSVEFQWAKGLWFLAAGVTTLINQEAIAAHLQAAMRREPIDNIIRPRRVRL
jgi:hypothetical protein